MTVAVLAPSADNPARVTSVERGSVSNAKRRAFVRRATATANRPLPHPASTIRLGTCSRTQSTIGATMLSGVNTCPSRRRVGWGRAAMMRSPSGSRPMQIDSEALRRSSSGGVGSASASVTSRSSAGERGPPTSTAPSDTASRAIESSSFMMARSGFNGRPLRVPVPASDSAFRRAALVSKRMVGGGRAVAQWASVAIRAGMRGSRLRWERRGANCGPGILRAFAR